MAVLIGMSGDVKGKSFPITDQDLSIGRNGDNTISINNATVSGHHCVIRREGDRYLLRDLGSTNGTRVNAHEVKEATLKPKDLVQAGSVEFLFNSEDMSFEDAVASQSATEVVEADGPTARPESFNNISPFGARRRENQTLWSMLIIVLGVLALLVVAYLFFKLVTT